jgi:hypothetical protein
VVLSHSSHTPLPPRPQNDDHNTDHNNRTTNTDAALSDATTTNTVVVENGTTMEMTTMDTTIRDRSAVELVSTQVEHPVLLSKESQDFDNRTSKNFDAKEIKDLGGGGQYLVAQSFYRGEKKDEELDEKDIEICLQLTLQVHLPSLGQNKLLGNFLDLLFQKIETIRDLNLKKNLYNSVKKACPNCRCDTCLGCTEHETETQKDFNIPSLPPIPTTYGKIRLVILEGSKSLIPMLAHPDIRTMGNHALCSAVPMYQALSSKWQPTNDF